MKASACLLSCFYFLHTALKLICEWVQFLSFKDDCSHLATVDRGNARALSLITSKHLSSPIDNSMKAKSAGAPPLGDKLAHFPFIPRLTNIYIRRRGRKAQLRIAGTCERAYLTANTLRGNHCCVYISGDEPAARHSLRLSVSGCN